MKKIIVLILINISLLLFFPCIPAVTFKNSKHILQGFCSVEAVKAGFTINYTHSVNKGRVHDYYHVEKSGNLNLYQTLFVSYGAGIPEPSELEGAVFTVTDEGYLLSNINRYMNELAMFVGVIAEHSVTVNNNEIYLKNYFPSQTGIIIKKENISLIKYLAWRTRKNEKKRTG